MRSISRFAHVAVLVLLAGAAVPGGAQNATQSAAPASAPATAPAPATVSPAKKELVRKALQLQQTGIEGMGAGMANQTAGQVLQMVSPAVARVPEDKRQALANDLQAEVRRFQNDVTPILRASAVKWAPSTLGTALEQKFTEDELKILVAWLESPVSRKFQQVAPEAQQALAQKVVAETRQQIEPKLKALEQTMVAKLKTASAASPASAPSAAQPAAKK